MAKTIEDEYFDTLDEIRIQEAAKRDLEFQAILGNETALSEALTCSSNAEIARRKAEVLLDDMIKSDSIRMQLVLIEEWSIKVARRAPDDYLTSLWIEQYGDRFREHWENGIKDSKSLALHLYGKR